MKKTITIRIKVVKNGKTYLKEFTKVVTKEK